MTLFSLDLGGSTIDLVEMDAKTLSVLSIESIESKGKDKNDLNAILRYFSATPKILQGKHLIITGGHSRFFPSKTILQGIEISLFIVPELEAIARGGTFLAQKDEGLVVSLGTGTAMVSVTGDEWEHVRGTGIGGGTFLGLGRALLQSDSFDELKRFSERGDISRIDLSVGEIVGGDLENLSKDATASHFAKYDPLLSRPEDIALGIARLVGQSIALLALEKAKNYNHTTIILGGKLTRLSPVVHLISETGKMFRTNILVPQNGEILTAIGAVKTFLFHHS